MSPSTLTRCELLERNASPSAFDDTFFNAATFALVPLPAALLTMVVVVELAVAVVVAEAGGLFSASPLRRERHVADLGTAGTAGIGGSGE
jgi:hypothetical protein